MNKQEFLAKLQNSLSGLPREEVEERLAFYREMIEDRMEDGIPEEEAVAALGSPMEIAEEILCEMPLTKLVKARVRAERRRRGDALLWGLSPLWIPLLLVGAVLLLALYVVLWSVVVSLWAVVVSLTACALGGILYLPFGLASGNAGSAVGLFGAGLLLAGLGILFLLATLEVTRGVIRLCGLLPRAVKRIFIRKESIR